MEVTWGRSLAYQKSFGVESKCIEEREEDKDT
jgi:hypothetical protein